jgi:Kef-type K+ transport system membrane component KefB
LRIGHLLACRLSIAAAAVTDMACWVVLLGLLAPEQGALGSPIAALLLIAAAAAIAWFVVRPALRWLVVRGSNVGGQAGALAQGVVLASILLSAWLATRAGIHFAVGAMLPGLLLGAETAFARRWQEATEGLLRLLLVPVFFVHAGMGIDLSQSFSSTFLAWTLAFIAVAVATKFFGAYLTARACGLGRSDARVIGALMNTRGMMELIIVKIGFDQGIITRETCTILFVVAVVTTVMASPLIRRWTRASEPGLVPVVP